MGQTEKNSVRAYVFRFTPELGHCSPQSACVKRANFGPNRYISFGHAFLVATTLRSSSSVCGTVPNIRTTVPSYEADGEFGVMISIYQIPEHF
jgi:hypothetical protein